MLSVRGTQVSQMAQSSPGRQMIQPCNDTKTWVEVCLIDASGAPVPNQRYSFELPDGSIMQGNLDEKGKARYDSIVAGTCQVSFPDIHSDEWKRA